MLNNNKKLNMDTKLEVGSVSPNDAKRLVVRSFYVLTHCGQFIDERLLQKGLYATSVPKLYSKETTIDLMIQQGRTIVDMTGNQFIEESYFDNLSKCKLTEVQLSVFE